MKIVDSTTLYISLILRSDILFSPIVISRIPFMILSLYNDKSRKFIIKVASIKKDVNVPKIKSRVSIDDFIEVIKVLLKL